MFSFQRETFEWRGNGGETSNWNSAFALSFMTFRTVKHMLTKDVSAVSIFAHKNIGDKVWMEKQHNLANTFPGELHVEQRKGERA